MKSACACGEAGGRSGADEGRGADVGAKIRQIDFELGIITGLAIGFEQRRAERMGQTPQAVRRDFERRNGGKLPDNWRSAIAAARGKFSRNVKELTNRQASTKSAPAPDVDPFCGVHSD